MCASVENIEWRQGSALCESGAIFLLMHVLLCRKYVQVQIFLLVSMDGSALF